MVKVQPGQWPRHKSMLLPDFSLKLHYFWMVSPTCPPQRSPVRKLLLCHDFLEAQLGLGYLWGIWATQRDNARDGTFSSIPSAARGCAVGRLILFPAPCLGAGAKGCGLIWRSGLVTGARYCRDTPNQLMSCRGCLCPSLACNWGCAFYIVLRRLRYDSVHSPLPNISLDCQCL